jgi:hypothetical protein
MIADRSVPLAPGDKVRVYYNIHRKCYSVLRAGRVVAHVDAIGLVDVRFRVSEAGRRRVLRERRKNVHAFVCGTVSADPGPCEVGVTYQPYIRGDFVRRADLRPVHEAPAARLDASGVRIGGAS